MRVLYFPFCLLQSSCCYFPTLLLQGFLLKITWKVRLYSEWLFRFWSDIWINMRDYWQKRSLRLLIWAYTASSCRACFYLNSTGDVLSRLAVSSATYFTFNLSKRSCFQYQISQSDTKIMNVFPINQWQGGLHLRFTYRDLILWNIMQ